MKYFIFFISGTLMISCTSNSKKAELIIQNAVIWTANPEQPYAEALAVKAGKILAVGSTDDIQQYAGSDTEITDADSGFIVPGFIDSHVHFIVGGKNLSSVQLRDASTPEEFIHRIAEYARTLKPGEWITGGDWDHKLWGGELPRKEWIDSVTKENPVLVNRLDGHMALVNSLTLSLEGINKETKSVEGGEIVIDDKTGDPTGIFLDNAYFRLLGNAMPADSEEQQESYMKAAMQYVVSHGVTSIHDMDGVESQKVFERLRDKGDMTVRVYSCSPLASWKLLQQKIIIEGTGDEWVKTGGLKGFVDGSLGSHTAAFFDPYSDAPEHNGFFVNTKEELYRWISGADSARLQVVVHAIGDSANSSLLDIYEQVTNENEPRDRRFRIEHAQHIATEDFRRFAVLNVIASVQPYHLIDDGRWAEKVIGAKRIKTTYPFRSYLDADVRIALGSDWFVAPPIPLMGIYAAVTRATLDSKNPDGWVPEQKIMVEEALRGYTIDAAYASFDEDIKGSLEPGKLADFVIIDLNLIEIEPERIRDAQVVMTFVGGRKVFGRSVH